MSLEDINFEDLIVFSTENGYINLRKAERYLCNQGISWRVVRQELVQILEFLGCQCYRFPELIKPIERVYYQAYTITMEVELQALLEEKLDDLCRQRVITEYKIKLHPPDSLESVGTIWIKETKSLELTRIDLTV